MTLDERIESLERWADLKPSLGEEYHQLAEWLKELKAYRDNSKECAFCKHLGNIQICGRCRIHNLYAPMSTNMKAQKRFELKPVHKIDCPWK